MSLALVAALALSPAATAAQCSWDRPGVDPFMGNVPAAVDRYTDIPVAVRERLKARMSKRQYDEIATIRRDSITGHHRYDEELRDMHFGEGRVCRTISRARWTDDTVERGLVYCEGEHCIIVPTVCRNVSRVTRLSGPPVPAAGGEGGIPGFAGGPGTPAATGPDQTAKPLGAGDIAGTGPLVFESPNAGTSFADASQPAPTPGSGAREVAAPVSGQPFALPLGAGGSSPSVSGPGSALDVPVGVAPIGSGTVGGGGIFLPPDTPGNPPPGFDPPVPEIPEPSTWLLWLTGLMATAWAVRRRRR